MKQQTLDEKATQLAQIVSGYEGKVLDVATDLAKKGYIDEAASLAGRFGEKVTKASEESFFKDSQSKETSEQLQKLSADLSKAIASIINRLFRRKNNEEADDDAAPSL